MIISFHKIIVYYIILFKKETVMKMSTDTEPMSDLPADIMQQHIH